jgi:hypothetical protein
MDLGRVFRPLVRAAEGWGIGEVTPEDLALGDKEFKEKHDRLRQRTKPLVLGPDRPGARSCGPGAIRAPGRILTVSRRETHV